MGDIRILVSKCRAIARHIVKRPFRCRCSRKSWSSDNRGRERENERERESEREREIKEKNRDTIRDSGIIRSVLRDSSGERVWHKGQRLRMFWVTWKSGVVFAWLLGSLPGGA